MPLELTYPQHFPAFVAFQIQQGMSASDVRYLLEKPHKWSEEFERFASMHAEGILTQDVCELADSIGINPGDVIDHLIRAGVEVYWIGGSRCDWHDAQDFAARVLRPDIEVDLTPAQVAALAQAWEVSEADLRSGKALKVSE